MVLGIFFYLFAIGVFTMHDNQSIFLDIVNFIIFIVIPFSKFIVYYISFLIICIKDIIHHKKVQEIDNRIKNPFQYWIQLNNLTNQGEYKLGLIDNDNKFENKKINWFEKLIFIQFLSIVLYVEKNLK